MPVKISTQGLLILILASAGLWSCNRPIARFSYSPEELKAPAIVDFQNQSEKADGYLWNFGDGDTSGTVEPSHRFLQSGNYTVTLVAKQGKKSRSEDMEIKIDPPEKTLVELQTPFGNMLIELFDSTPEHRDNFYKLAEEGFYDSLLFHRVMEGFMIQGGDPNSRDAPAGQPLGMGGPGYTVPADFQDSLIHTKGALAAARQPDSVNPEKASSGSQFYIVQGQTLAEREMAVMEARSGRTYTDEQKEAYLNLGGTPFLDGEYTVFGRVVEGLDVIDKIAAVETDSRNRPKDDVVIKVVPIR